MWHYKQIVYLIETGHVPAQDFSCVACISWINGFVNQGCGA